MEPTNLTIEILKSIRDEIRQTNVRLERVEIRLENVESEVKALRKSQVDSETRLATELIAVVHAVHEVRDVLRDNADLRRKVDDHEQRLHRIEQRVTG